MSAASGHRLGCADAKPGLSGCAASQSFTIIDPPVRPKVIAGTLVGRTQFESKEFAALGVAPQNSEAGPSGARRSRSMRRLA